MSNVHVREKDPKNKTVNCIFHFNVPETNNAVGVPWTEVVQKGLLPEPIMADNDSTENAQITAGTVLEVQETVRFSSTNITDAQRIVEIQSAYTAKQTSVFSDLVDKLDFFGKPL